MFCQKCGSQIPDTTVICPVCGENVNSAHQPQPQPVIPSMKWYNFLTKFALICGAILNIITGISLLTGSVYGSDAELVYLVFPTLRPLDIIIALLIIGLAAFAFYVRKRLVGYYQNAPKLLTMLYLGVVIVDLIYIIGLSAILPSYVLSEVLTPSMYSNLIVSVVMMFVNMSYFKKRSHLFTNY